MKRFFLSILAVLATAGLYAFLPATVITVKGSDTMVILAQKWAETYQSKNPGVSNGVQKLSVAQLKGIFTGRITNWNQAGGKNGRIVMYGRENSSGTYVFFRVPMLTLHNMADNSPAASPPGVLSA